MPHAHASSCFAATHLRFELCVCWAVRTGRCLPGTAHDAMLLLGCSPPQEPTTLDELKEVLGIVAAVRGEGMMMELRCSELEERYRTRLLYAVGEVAAAQFAADLADASRIAAEWKELTEAAERRDCELEDVKGRFSETTRQQVRNDFGRGLVHWPACQCTDGCCLALGTLLHVCIPTHLHSPGGRVHGPDTSPGREAQSPGAWSAWRRAWGRARSPPCFPAGMAWWFAADSLYLSYASAWGRLQPCAMLAAAATPE